MILQFPITIFLTFADPSRVIRAYIGLWVLAWCIEKLGTTSAEFGFV
jgi:hypothetical protein